MPRKPRTNVIAPESTDATPAAAAPRGAKTAAIKAALEGHPDKLPKEISELLKADGWDVPPQRISVIKSGMKAKTKEQKAPVVAKKETAPASPKSGDAVSFDALLKAKDLAAQLGGVTQAKAALAALSELLD